MRFKTIAAAGAVAAMAVSAPAMAQDVGATIMDDKGGTVGTVVSTDGTTIVVDTGAHKVPLGADSIVESEGTFIIGATKAELDATMAAFAAEREAALAAALVEGAAVLTADAQPLGTVATVEEEAVVVTYEAAPLTLPKTLFVLDGEGALVVRANHAAIVAAIEAAAS